MMPIITLDAGRVQADVARAGKQLDVALRRTIEATKLGMLQLAEHIGGEASENLESQTRSGGLRESWTVGDMREEAGTLVVDFGFNKSYAAQVDRGGEILPRGRMLAIPLRPILTGRGVPRYSSPREEPDLQLVVLAGKVFLMKKVKRARKNWSNLFHWLLVPRVEQSGSGYFRRAVLDNVPKASEVVADAVRRGLHG